MTSREDLLDQYIDALNEGNLDDAEVRDDEELRSLLDAARTVKKSGEIQWPESDFPDRMSQTLVQELGGPASAMNVNEQSTESTGIAETQPETVSGRASGNGDDEVRNARWYSKQFAGMIAAALIVISFGIGLTFILGDWGGEIHQPGAFVEEGDIPGTILFAEYDGEQTLSTINADGTNQQDLAQRPVSTADRAGFAWSPDGEWVAYVDPESGSRDALSVITLVSADGSETETIEMEPVEGVMRLTAGLTWADDGNHLALVHQDPDVEQRRIAIIHRPTGERMPVGESDIGSGNQGHPAWMPGSLSLAYSEGFADGSYTIFVTDGETEPETVVEDDDRAIQPHWSPDGSSIVYIGSSEDGERGSVHVVDLETGETENIYDHPERANYMPTWSSRDQIAFMSDFGDMDYDIFIVNPDGSEIRNITEEIGWSASIPDWSEDGRYLTFTSMSPDQEMWRINVYDVDEDRLYSVHESENPLFYAQWRPEGDPEDVSEPEETPETDADVSVDEPSEAMQDLLRMQAEQFISEDDDPVALTVNDREVTEGQIESNQATAEIRRTMMQDVLEEQREPHPEIDAQNQLHIELINEYGPENVGLGLALVSELVQEFAEENDFIATDEQIETAMQQQRDAHEMIEEQDPEAAAAVGEAQIDVIGEERYWEEFLPGMMAQNITEQNVDEHVWATADIPPDEEFSSQRRQQLYLAEFRAELVEEADIEVVDNQLLGNADLDRAIEYVAEALPAAQQELMEMQPEQGQDQAAAPESAYPQVPRDGLQSEAHVERYVQELFERQGYPDAELREIRETTREGIGVQDWSTQIIGEPDDLIWEVETAGFIPEQLADEPAADGEVPDPDNVETRLWIDPDHGVLPVFDATDVTR